MYINNYYQKHKERLRKEACERYQNLCAEEKDKRRKKAPERYQNFTEKEKRHQYYLECKKLPNYRYLTKNLKIKDFKEFKDFF